MSVLCCVLLYDFVHCLLLRRNNKYITSPQAAAGEGPSSSQSGGQWTEPPSRHNPTGHNPRSIQSILFPSPQLTHEPWQERLAQPHVPTCVTSRLARPSQPLQCLSTKVICCSSYPYVALSQSPGSCQPTTRIVLHGKHTTLPTWRGGKPKNVRNLSLAC